MLTNLDLLYWISITTGCPEASVEIERLLSNMQGWSCAPTSKVSIVILDHCIAYF